MEVNNKKSKFDKIKLRLVKRSYKAIHFNREIQLLYDYTDILIDAFPHLRGKVQIKSTNILKVYNYSILNSQSKKPCPKSEFNLKTSSSKNYNNSSVAKTVKTYPITLSLVLAFIALHAFLKSKISLLNKLLTSLHSPKSLQKWSNSTKSSPEAK